jgi:Uncharacterised nucleotidyltransferase
VTTTAIDEFLTLVVRHWLRGDTAPEWPSDWPNSDAFGDEVFARIAFHGIALLIVQNPAALGGWTTQLCGRVQAEARAQSFWELGHRAMLAQVIEALADKGMESIVTKGSAIAYALYPEPALRRRGDSDLLLFAADRREVGKALTAIGLKPIGDARPLQESWAGTCAMGFTHVFDLHWRGSASALVSAAFDRAGIGTRSIPLASISPGARGATPTDNLILIAMNRALHGHFGYVSGAAKAFEANRLIWAVDCDLLCASLTASEWQMLVDAATASGTAPQVLGALDFAAEALGTHIPAQFRSALLAQNGDPLLAQYCTAIPGWKRLRLDLSACASLTERAQVARYILFPGTELLHERFPDATHWPVPALQARRLIAGAGQLVRGRG